MSALQVVTMPDKGDTPELRVAMAAIKGREVKQDQQDSEQASRSHNDC